MVISALEKIKSRKRDRGYRSRGRSRVGGFVFLNKTAWRGLTEKVTHE